MLKCHWSHLLLGPSPPCSTLLPAPLPLHRTDSHWRVWEGSSLSASTSAFCTSAKHSIKLLWYCVSEEDIFCWCSPCIGLGFKFVHVWQVAAHLHASYFTVWVWHIARTCLHMVSSEVCVVCIMLCSVLKCQFVCLIGVGRTSEFYHEKWECWSKEVFGRRQYGILGRILWISSANCAHLGLFH